VIELKKPMALFFAVFGVLLLVAIPISISFRQPWLVLFFSILSIAFIGFGFVVKARLRKKQL
jgi:NADH:ubiquinone oxidoreductase subunit 3 (subunit A)